MRGPSLEDDTWNRAKGERRAGEGKGLIFPLHLPKTAGPNLCAMRLCRQKLNKTKKKTPTVRTAPRAGAAPSELQDLSKAALLRPHEPGPRLRLPQARPGPRPPPSAGLTRHLLATRGTARRGTQPAERNREGLQPPPPSRKLQHRAERPVQSGTQQG